MTDTFLDQKSLTSSAQSRFDHMLFERLPIGLAVCDMQGQLVYINEAFAAIIDYSVNQALKLTYWELTPIEFEAQEQEQLASLQETGRYGPYEKEYIHKDGHCVPVRLSGVIIRENNQDYIYSSVEDITARKEMEEALRQSEERLSLHVENTPLGVISWDKDNNCIQWNPAAEKIFGFTPDEALGGNALELLVPEETHDQIDGIFEALLNQSGGSHSINENVTKDGRTILCEWFNTPLKDEDGTPIGVASLVQDITERKRAADELKAHRDHLEEMVNSRTAEVKEKAVQLEDALAREKEYSNMQQEFLSVVSHEFRTPLTIIDGTAQRLIRRKDKLDPEEVETRAKTVRSAVSRMIDLIDTTLHVARLDGGKIELKLSSCNIRELIGDICDRQAEVSRSHEFQVEIDDLPSEIIADPARIDQVFTNLLSNAVKYAPKDPFIEIKGWVDEGDALVSVTDYGVGIPENELPQMFNRFFRAKTSEGIKGTGIGLSVVKEFVEMHGGEILLDSIEGEGSTFTVRIPIGGIKP